jgi:hypothetical protein
MKRFLTRSAVALGMALVVLFCSTRRHGCARDGGCICATDDHRYEEIIPYFATSFGGVQDRIVVDDAHPWQEHEKKIGIRRQRQPADVVNQITPVPKWAARLALVPWMNIYGGSV